MGADGAEKTSLGELQNYNLSDGCKQTASSAQLTVFTHLPLLFVHKLT